MTSRLWYTLRKSGTCSLDRMCSVIKSIATMLLSARPHGMMTSACLREGATNASNAGLTNLVYCSITPATSLPRTATSR